MKHPYRNHFEKMVSDPKFPRKYVIVVLLITIFLILVNHAFGQCEPYKYGPYTPKEKIPVVSIIQLGATFGIIEFYIDPIVEFPNDPYGIKKMQLRNKVAFTGLVVMIGTGFVDAKIKQHKKRHQVRLVYGNSHKPKRRR